MEAATQAALVELAPTILDAGRDLVVLSVGALLDHPEWVERAAARGARIHAPSAAIAGLDGLKGAAVDGHLDAVVMETRKPPARASPERPGSPGSTSPRSPHRRSSSRAPPGRRAGRFPPTSTSWRRCRSRGSGPDRTRIRIHADPTVSRNRHTVTAEGAFGRLRIEIENVPSENPRTGKLSYLSTIAYLRGLGAPLHVGT